ncbi:hypothetical protein FZEAL_2108 [Fusarium zealandicum]|uniref:DUF7082 domain-containing protein n=1 Tax=Fusarium zealandicum TaxID=1053134 RepID=A0A8H4US13_9HYPO|nr:hypothetical protein FZEAL_2108 [Fusarium zealandicum]
MSPSSPPFESAVTLAGSSETLEDLAFNGQGGQPSPIPRCHNTDPYHALTASSASGLLQDRRVGVVSAGKGPAILTRPEAKSNLAAHHSLPSSSTVSIPPTIFFFSIGLFQGRDGLDRSDPQVLATRLVSPFRPCLPALEIPAQPHLNHHGPLLTQGKHLAYAVPTSKEMLPHVPHPSSAPDAPINPPGRDLDFPKSFLSEPLRSPALNHLPAPVCLPTPPGCNKICELVSPPDPVSFSTCRRTRADHQQLHGFVQLNILSNYTARIRPTLGLRLVPVDLIFGSSSASHWDYAYLSIFEPDLPRQEVDFQHHLLPTKSSSFSKEQPSSLIGMPVSLVWIGTITCPSEFHQSNLRKSRLAHSDLVLADWFRWIRPRRDLLQPTTQPLPCKTGGLHSSVRLPQERFSHKFPFTTAWMSVVKFQCPPYKLFEPDYHPQKPIIVGVDDRLESPDTLTLRYEEAARAANGGDPRGDSPPRLLEMATYTKAQLPSMHAGYDATRYQDAAYEQYPTQSFPTQQQTDKFAHLNQQSFASNNAAVAQYMPSGPTVLSCQPTTGMFGTKVFVKVSSQYDLFSLSTPMPIFSLLFGSERCPAQDVSRDMQDSSGYIFTCSGDAPQFLVTGCASSNVPLSLLLEGPQGEEISRTVVGTFQYLEGSGDDITRSTKIPKHEDAAPAPTVDQPSTSPKAGEPQMPSEASTNTYEYPTQQGHYATAFPQGSNEMITTYRTTTFTDPHYHRRSAGGWGPYSSTLGSTGRGPVGLDSSAAGRPSLTPLPVPQTPGAPQLIRTSTIVPRDGINPSYHHPISLYSHKAVLKISGKLETMAENWTQEEWDNRRRIVMFRKTQRGSTVNANFQPVSVSERPQNSVCISCIWWAEKNECYVTSVDTIYLLEQLVAAPNRFSVEEKNRIRRNLEGFHPETVSKAKPKSEEFFKIIMAFPNPKPRNIEKDVKVFPWKILESALKKIIGKYSASPSSTVPPANSTNGPYPTPPGQSLTSQHDPHTQYSLPQHHDSIPSPRSLSGSQPTWAPYATAAPGYSTTASRTLSPGLRHHSPQQHQAPLRINTTPLPGVSSAYDNRSAGYGPTGLHTPLSHHPPLATPPRWDHTPATYSENYPSLTSQTAQPVYSTGAYGEPTPRA